MTEEKRIRVVLVDDHAVVRSGVSALLMAYEDLRLVGEANNGEEGVCLCRQLQPDVVLMDLVMPGMDGITATKAIKESCPRTQVIALTSFFEDERVQSVLKAGAIGYLLKNVSAQDLIAAIRNAAAGQPTLSAEAARALMHASTRPQPAELGLTEREREVLILMVKGLNNSQIAQQLVIGPSTAKFHVSNILTKMGVSTRTEAVALAVRDHIVDSA
jgi:NarL family two-component system response regulator LiaR